MGETARTLPEAPPRRGFPPPKKGATWHALPRSAEAETFQVSTLEAARNEPGDAELERIVDEEERCLTRVLEHLRARRGRPSDRPPVDYDAELLSLRDQIASARLEDVPPLIEQMERLQSLAARRREVAEGHVDPRSPYFGHLVLEEHGRRREVLIGRSTYLDTQSGVRIVDWRDAPVSRLYYRYEEGDEYEETFGEREISGRVVTRRSVTIADGVLRRIGSPQGSFVRDAAGAWKRLGSTSAKLHGGQGTAARAERHERPGRLGIGQEQIGEDKHLKEITPLIDQRQFELITRPDSGLVVIQGGAGSGKTTIGLHRLAYLTFHDPRRFRADRMLVVVFNEALARYISQVLPALGIEGVATRTYETWAERLRAANFPNLPAIYHEDTPSAVTKLKKHPALLRAIDERVASMEQDVETELERAIERGNGERDGAALESWQKTRGRAPYHRLHALSTWVQGERGRALSTDARVALERVLRANLRRAKDAVWFWADLITDRSALERMLERHAPGAFTAAELTRAHNWCAARVGKLVVELEDADEAEATAPARAQKRQKVRERRPAARDAASGEGFEGPGGEHDHGVDGHELDELAKLDREDDTLLLRIAQRLHGSLKRPGKAKEPLVYEHVLVDEAQDLSPVELAVVTSSVSKAQSVTFAGDVSQRLMLDNGFSNWKTVLGDLGLSHVEVEPLRLSYRSTEEIIEFARAVLGPLAPQEEGQATRSGAPVELFGFAHSGEAAGLLSESLRELMQSEPRASVAVIARYPEQADLYYDALLKAEVNGLRRISQQDFPFKPGIDVTDVRQVKGLEFDYVVLVEVGDASYPSDDEARHLLHIGATRAAHQLWVVTTGRPSPLLPKDLVQRGY
jgi:DNA helicase II / ATP-dependent DNA helicase PcrA